MGEKHLPSRPAEGRVLSLLIRQRIRWHVRAVGALSDPDRRKVFSEVVVQVDS